MVDGTATVAQLVEHFTRNEKVASSILAGGSKENARESFCFHGRFLSAEDLPGISERLESRARRCGVGNEELAPFPRTGSRSIPLVFQKSGNVSNSKHIPLMGPRAPNAHDDRMRIFEHAFADLKTRVACARRIFAGSVVAIPAIHLQVSACPVLCGNAFRTKVLGRKCGVELLEVLVSYDHGALQTRKNEYARYSHKSAK